MRLKGHHPSTPVSARRRPEKAPRKKRGQQSRANVVRHHIPKSEANRNLGCIMETVPCNSFYGNTKPLPSHHPVLAYVLGLWGCRGFFFSFDHRRHEVEIQGSLIDWLLAALPSISAPSRSAPIPNRFLWSTGTRLRMPARMKQARLYGSAAWARLDWNLPKLPAPSSRPRGPPSDPVGFSVTIMPASLGPHVRLTQRGMDGMDPTVARQACHDWPSRGKEALTAGLTSRSFPQSPRKILRPSLARCIDA